jgi:hypothetical protein
MTSFQTNDLKKDPGVPTGVPTGSGREDSTTFDQV